MPMPVPEGSTPQFQFALVFDTIALERFGEQVQQIGFGVGRIRVKRNQCQLIARERAGFIGTQHIHSRRFVECR